MGVATEIHIGDFESDHYFEEYQYFLRWRVVYDGTGRCQTVKMTNFFTRRAITINISCRAMCKLTTQPKTSTSFSTINFTVYTLWQPITTFNDHAKNEHQVQSMNTFIAFRSKLQQTGVSSYYQIHLQCTKVSSLTCLPSIIQDSKLVTMPLI